MRDYTIYPLAILLTAMVGMVDEYIQWVVPSRYYDLSDIKINVFAGLLAQVGLATGLRPRLVAYFPPGASWRRRWQATTSSSCTLPLESKTCPAAWALRLSSPICR